MTDVVVPLTFKADTDGMVRATSSGRKSLKDLQKQLNQTQKAANDSKKSVKGFAVTVQESIPLVNQLTGSLARFAKSPAGIVTGIGAASAAMGKFVSSQADAIDAIGKLVPVTNASVEALSQYEYVAELTGTSFKTITNGFTQLSTRLGKGSKATREAIEKLGLSFEQLSKLDTDQSFEAIALAMESIESPAERAAIAAELFGRSAGPELQKVLSAGAAGIREMREEADELGQTISDETAADAARFNDELTRLTALFTASGRAIARDLLGPGADLIKWLRELIVETKKGAAALVDLAAGFLGLEKRVEIAQGNANVQQLKRLREEALEALKAIRQFRGEADSPELEVLRERLRVAEKAYNDFKKAAKEGKLEVADTGDTVERVTIIIDQHSESVDDATESIEMMTSHVDLFRQAQKDAAAALKADLIAAERELQETSKGTRLEFDGFISDLSDGDTMVSDFTFDLKALGSELINVGAAFAGAAVSGGSFSDGLQAALPMLGRTAGSAIGSQWGPITEQLGAAAGSFLGSALGGLFGGGDKKPKVRFQSLGGDFGNPLANIGNTGVQVSSDLANLQLLGSGGRRVPGSSDLLRAVEDLDNRIASTLSVEELQTARRAANFNIKDDLSGFNFEARLIERTRQIFLGIGGELGAAFELLAGEADVTADELTGIVDAISMINAAIDQGTISEEFPGTVDEVIAKLQELQEGNESIAQTYSRVVFETETVNAALESIGFTSADVGAVVATTLTDMAGGIDRLTRLSNTFRNEFLSEEQRNEIDRSVAQVAVDQFVADMAELELSVDLTREGFADFVLGLDLTTEAGQQAHVAALEVASSLDVLLDAEEQANEGVQDLTGSIDDLTDSTTDAGDSVDDATDSVGNLSESLDDVADNAEGATRGVDRLTNTIRNLGLAGEKSAAQSRFDQINFVGDLFGPNLREALMLDYRRLYKERADAEAEQRANIERYGYGPGSRDLNRVLDRFISQIDKQIESTRETILRIDELERQFPGLGEQRYRLEQEFAALFDGSDLLPQEREAGLARFRERWQEIIDRALAAIVDPIIDPDPIPDPDPDTKPPPPAPRDLQGDIRDRESMIRLFGDLLGGSLEDQIRVNMFGLRREIAQLEREQADDPELITPILTRLRQQLEQEKNDLQTLRMLEAQFPGLGEERFALMREFSVLFDGTLLNPVERELGMEEFRRRWEAIVEGAASAVIDPIIELDNRASEIERYLRGVLIGPGSTLSQMDQLGLAERDFFDLVARAQAGEDVSAADLTAAHQALAQEIRDTFGFGPESTDRLGAATEALTELGLQLAVANDQQVLVDQLEELRALVEEMRAVRLALEDANSVNKRAL